MLLTVTIGTTFTIQKAAVHRRVRISGKECMGVQKNDHPMPGITVINSGIPSSGCAPSRTEQRKFIASNYAKWDVCPCGAAFRRL
ncbi:hypothetical protein ACIRF8_00455 [Streptomyces sp. NPDC102406]|uniref:hypothetical protein n=1 Tax=Streptomyces sp. NPDC102406 TaxID=3366171 RepID=UPI003830B24C